MKRFITFSLALMLCISVFAKSERRTVILDVDLHCQGCITKIEKNIAFEPGVKDLICSLDDKTVTVTFDPSKTDIDRLLAAFSKINKPATLHDAEADTEQVENKSVDARTGASTPQ